MVNSLSSISSVLNILWYRSSLGWADVPLFRADLFKKGSQNYGYHPSGSQYCVM